MKKILLTLTLLLAALLLAQSQPPQALKYKAVAKDEWGVALPSKEVTLQFSILLGSEDGTVVYQELHYTTTNKFGLMDVNVGQGNPIYGYFDEIDWGAGSYFMQVGLDTKGGTDFRLEGSSQLLSVPYALYAGKSKQLEVIPVIDYNDLTNKPDFTYWDQDVSDDFSGSWTDLTGIPPDFDDGIDDNTQLTEAEVDAYVENNGYLTVEVDGDPANELQVISISNDTIFLTEGGFAVLPKPFSEGGSYYFADVDVDGYGNIYDPVWVPSNVNSPFGFVDNEEDCDDNNKWINPDAADYNDGIDNDCDGRIDVLDGRSDVDDDGDGFTEDEGDLDDTNPAIYPDAPEICDNVDNNGDGVVDEGCTVQDIEGNEYRIVEIGDYIWMAGNLRTATYNDGTPITNVSDANEWTNSTTGAYCWYNNNSSAYDTIYGKLYNWYAVETGNLCPTGYHVPTQVEWQNLINNSGGYSNLIASGTNTTGFSATLSGERSLYYFDQDYIFYNMNQSGTYWTSDKVYTSDTYPYNRAYAYEVFSSYFSRTYQYTYLTQGSSIRCVRSKEETQDADGDGFYSDFDCNDNDPSIHPYAEETCGDGIDQDCIYGDIHCDNFDFDQDGKSIYQGDCDDNDPTLYPGASEICGDGIDQDCDGSDLECDDFLGRIENGDSISAFLDEGYTVSQLYDAGIQVGQMEKAGVDSLLLANEGFIGTLSDIDGNDYKWVKIGDQIWMAENLRVTKLNDGTAVPLVENSVTWTYTTGPGMAWKSTSEYSRIVNGGLYNWFTVETGNICPSGWHVPTNAEWNILVQSQGSQYSVANKLMARNRWYSSYQGWIDNEETNNSGFTAIAAEYRTSSGYYPTTYWPDGAWWWTSDVISETHGQNRNLKVNSYQLNGGTASKNYGYSIRCLRSDTGLDEDGDGILGAYDCNDNDASIYPGATDICDDGIDQNCDGSDASCALINDDDGDGLSESQGDCDDADPQVYPGQTLWFDSISSGGSWDYNCDGTIEAKNTQLWDYVNQISGWQSYVPVCGETANYVEYTGTGQETLTITQSCR